VPDGFVGDVLHVIKATDIAGNMDCLSSVSVDFACYSTERFIISCVQDNTSTTLRRHPRSDQSNPRRRTSNHDDLIVEILEFDIHGTLTKQLHCQALVKSQKKHK
jgi:hypothetical protein